MKNCIDWWCKSMNKFINRFYGIGLLIAMFIAISIFSVFKYFDTHLSEEVSRSLNLKSDYWIGYTKLDRFLKFL